MILRWRAFAFLFSLLCWMGSQRRAGDSDQIQQPPTVSGRGQIERKPNRIRSLRLDDEPGESQDDEGGMTRTSDDAVCGGTHASADEVEGRRGPQPEVQGILSSVRADY